MPKFMRSHGPFAVYDHAAHKGVHSYETVGAVNEQALGRFNEQIQGVQKTRHNEKKQFYSAIDYMDKMEFLKVQDRKHQNREHSDFLRSQIAEKQKRKVAEQAVEVLYYKPHFGPEETLDNVQKGIDDLKQKQEFIKMNLQHQINAKTQLSEAKMKDERHADRKIIKAQIHNQELEQIALMKKDQVMK